MNTSDAKVPADLITVLRVSKIDAASRQLDTAIRLWFQGGDPVSTHTLAAAAEGVLRTLACDAGPADPREWDGIKPHYKDEWKQLLNQAANFFKHADRDPHSVLEFRVGQTEFVMLWCVARLNALGHRSSVLAEAFWGWTYFHRPELLTPVALDQQCRDWGQGGLATMRALSKQAFLDRHMRERSSSAGA